MSTFSTCRSIRISTVSGKFFEIFLSVKELIEKCSRQKLFSIKYLSNEVCNVQPRPIVTPENIGKTFDYSRGIHVLSLNSIWV